MAKHGHDERRPLDSGDPASNRIIQNDLERHKAETTGTRQSETNEQNGDDPNEIVFIKQSHLSAADPATIIAVRTDAPADDNTRAQAASGLRYVGTDKSVGFSELAEPNGTRYCQAIDIQSSSGDYMLTVAPDESEQTAFQTPVPTLMKENGLSSYNGESMSAIGRIQSGDLHNHGEGGAYHDSDHGEQSYNDYAV